MSHTKPCSAIGRIVYLFIAIFCVSAAIFLVTNKQYVVDQLNAWQFTPSSAVASLADRSGMSDTGRFYFYTSHPSIDSAQAFNKECVQKESTTAILGCYNGQNIYVYNVTDARLDGIQEVTAAHEMLHAAYARMGDSEKQQVDALLETEYNKLKDDKDFADRVAFYERTEPGERDNELHSVIGTEVASISPQLESHYKKYFSNRSAVVALHTKYMSVFTNLQQQSQTLSDQLTQLGNQIESNSAAYNTHVSQLNADIQAFNAKANNGGFATEAEFQSERAGLVARATQLNGDRTTVNNLVDQYNALKQELESVASQSDALNRSIDSSLAPAPSL